MSTKQAQEPFDDRARRVLPIACLLLGMGGLMAWASALELLDGDWSREDALAGLLALGGIFLCSCGAAILVMWIGDRFRSRADADEQP